MKKLSKKYDELLKKQNYKCVLSGFDITLNNSVISKINKKLKKTKENIILVHKNFYKILKTIPKEQFLEFCRSFYLKSFEEQFERPSFEEYFILLAFDVSLRSEDPNIKHGAIIVNNYNHIIGTGYNATIRKSDKSKIEMNNRDKKRHWMIHAEENAILNCTKNPIETNGATLYVTGIPCVNCLQRVINFGINKIYYADRMGTSTENAETQEMREKIIEMSKIQIKKISLDNKWIKRSCLCV